MFGSAHPVPELSVRACSILEHQTRETGVPIMDRAAAFLRVLERWPDTIALFRSVLEKTADANKLIKLSERSAVKLLELPSKEKAELMLVLALGYDPLGSLALIPAGVGPINDRELNDVNPNRQKLYGSYQRVITLIAKLTRYCSLRCTYCNDWRTGPEQNMPLSVQRKMLEHALSDGTFGCCKIVWHGGEPAQLGVRRALQFLWLQARLKRPNQLIHNSVQTNGAFIPSAMVDLWQAFGMRVSVSLDGPREIHNQTRKTIAGSESFDNVVEGIRQLKAAGIFGGALIVVTQEVASYPPKLLIENLIESGVHHAAFLPVRPSARDGRGPYLSPERFAAFLIGLFDTLRNNPELDFDVREIDALYSAYTGRPSGFCELNGPCLGSYFGVNPDGSVMHCDKFLDADDYVLGNVSEHSFDMMARSHRVETLRVEDANNRERLSDCRWYGRCHGWCPHERLIAGLKGDDQALCCGLSAVFDHFESLEQSAAKQNVV